MEGPVDQRGERAVKKKKGPRFTPKTPSFIKNAWHKDCTCATGHCLYHDYPKRGPLT
jgi:hypothetical protein